MERQRTCETLAPGEAAAPRVFLPWYPGGKNATTADCEINFPSRSAPLLVHAKRRAARFINSLVA